MRKTKKTVCTLAAILIISTIALTSCRTSQITAVEPLQIDTHFPPPYDENGDSIVSFDDDNTVKMPLWYWLKITEYAIDTESNRLLLTK